MLICDFIWENQPRSELRIPISTKHIKSNIASVFSCLVGKNKRLVFLALISNLNKEISLLSVCQRSLEAYKSQLAPNMCDV